jgi:hypothetical protein
MADSSVYISDKVAGFDHSGFCAYCTRDSLKVSTKCQSAGMCLYLPVVARGSLGSREDRWRLILDSGTVQGHVAV